MAGPTKRAKKPEPQSSDDEMGSEDSENESYDGQKEVQATFEGRNLEGQDFHGIKQLLKQLFLKAHIDLSEICDLLMGQNGVGSVLKQSYNDSDDEEDAEMVDESDVFGVTTVLRIGNNKNVASIQQLLELIKELSEKHGSKEVKDKFNRILNESRNLGLLINERFVNIPAKISSVMLNSLYEEIEKKKRKNDESYNFDKFILICKTSRPKDKKNEDEYFTNDEEMFFSQAAEVSFDFCVQDSTDTSLAGTWKSGDEQLIPYRRVLVFQADKFKNLIDQITAFVQ